MRLVSRLPYGLASQILASGTNFLLLMTLARVQSIDEFGWSALSVAVVAAAVGVCRNVFGTPIALAADSPGHLRTEGSYGAQASALGTGAAVAPLLLWGVWQGDWLLALIATGAPIVVFHDTLRQQCFSAGLSKAAAIGDLLRVALLALPFVVSLYLAVAPWVSITLWVASAAAASWYLILRLHWRPFRSSLIEHWRHTATDRRALLGDGLIGQLTPIATSLLVGAALSGAALSAFRGGSTLLGPVAILLTAVPLLVMPRIVRDGAKDFDHVVARLRPVNFALSGACVVLAIISLAVPPSVGRIALGDSWSATQQILPIMALQSAIQPWTLSVTTALKLTGLARLLTPLRLVRSLAMTASVAIAVQFGSILWVVVTILSCEFLTAFGHMIIGHHYRSAPVQTAGSQVSASGEVA